MRTIIGSLFLSVAMFIVAFTPSAVAQVVEYESGNVPAHNVISSLTIFDSTGSNLDGGIQYSVNGSPVQGTFTGFNFVSGQDYLWSLRYDGFSVVIGASIYELSLSPVPTSSITLMSVGSSVAGSATADLLGANGLVVNHSIDSAGGAPSNLLWNSGITPGSQSGTFRFDGDGSYLRLDFISPVPEPAETVGVAGFLLLCFVAGRAIQRRRQKNRANEEQVFD